jgi:hypothetical protein
MISRELTPREREVGEWLLTHAAITEEQRRRFLAHLLRAKVIRECQCGCASIDFGIADLPVPKGGLRILGDFVCGENEDGIFIFEKENVLAGIEVYQMASAAPRKELPSPSKIHAF